MGDVILFEVDMWTIGTICFSKFHLDVDQDFSYDHMRS